MKKDNVCISKQRQISGMALFASKRGTTFLTAMFTLVILMGFGASFVQMSLQEITRASRIKKETRALALAESGLDYATWHIYNETPTSFPISFERDDFSEGYFEVDVTRVNEIGGVPVANVLQLQSTGVSQGFTVEVKAVGFFPITPGPNSSAFDNALFSNSDLKLTGTADIDGLVHSNGNVLINGTVNITGDTSAVGWIKDKHDSILGDALPYSTHETMPTVDLQYYRANATDYYSTSQNFSSTLELNGITFVDGDVSISGQVSGTGVIVANGDIHINGDVVRVNGDDDEFALISVGNIIVNGNCLIEGTIYAHNPEIPATFSGNGSATVLGAVVADLIDVSGTINVTYKQPTVDLPGSDNAPIQLDIVSWRRIH